MISSLATSKEEIDIVSIFRGDLVIIEDHSASEDLREFCVTCFRKHFGATFDLYAPLEMTKSDFISKATLTKKLFTNSEETKELLEKLILRRYACYANSELYYDVPRVRIIPNSGFLNSGISYNYLPHRDTWYGASQGQINHWIAVENVTQNATFFIAPSYFLDAVPNSSEIFDLDVWDQNYRPLASSNMTIEERPHPLPRVEIPDSRKHSIVIRKGQEICFSGHHLHGSLPNKTPNVRLSIDFRVEVEALHHFAPKSIDNKATGNYRKYMIKHPSFGC